MTIDERKIRILGLKDAKDAIRTMFHKLEDQHIIHDAVARIDVLIKSEEAKLELTPPVGEVPPTFNEKMSHVAPVPPQTEQETGNDRGDYYITQPEKKAEESNPVHASETIATDRLKEKADAEEGKKGTSTQEFSRKMIGIFGEIGQTSKFEQAVTFEIADILSRLDKLEDAIKSKQEPALIASEHTKASI